MSELPINIPTPQDSPKPMDDLAAIKARLTDVEKENFFKSFLADKPYTAEETLFHGKLQLKFTTLSIKENNTVMLQMQYDRDLDVAKNTDAYLIRVIQYRIAAALLELDHKPFAPEITEAAFPNNNKEGKTYLVEKLKLMEVWPVHKVSTITDAFNKFEKTVIALTEESFKENF
jgi:hypothetical protein